MIGSLILLAAQTAIPVMVNRLSGNIDSTYGDKQAKKYAALINLATAAEIALDKHEDVGDLHKEHPDIVAARAARAELRAEKDDALQARIKQELEERQIKELSDNVY